jgi:hypothetical protein
MLGAIFLDYILITIGKVESSWFLEAMRRSIHGALAWMTDKLVSYENIGGATYTKSALADRQHTIQLSVQFNAHLETISPYSETLRSQ